jgi:hypothetical protein
MSMCDTFRVRVMMMMTMSVVVRRHESIREWSKFGQSMSKLTFLSIAAMSKFSKRSAHFRLVQFTLLVVWGRT